ncbi:MAG TPA: 50S ribosomal protein L4 [Tissierellaceae bacterium]
MPKVNLYSMSGDMVEEIQLSEDIFGIEPNEHVVYEVVKNHLANKRQGTQSVKTRAEVRGGGRKPWRQKGTGRARHGSTRSPIWVGGGVTFAPKPRDYSYKLPKKVKRLAMKSVLSSKVASGELVVVENIDLETPKTKEALKVLSNFELGRKALIVTVGKNENLVKGTKNLSNVNTTVFENLNVYDILNHESLVLTREALEKVEEVFA